MQGNFKIDQSYFKENLIPLHNRTNGFNVNKSVSNPYIDKKLENVLGAFTFVAKDLGIEDKEITSALRNYETNSKLTTSAHNSKHLTGQALDFQIKNENDLKIYQNLFNKLQDINNEIKEGNTESYNNLSPSEKHLLKLFKEHQLDWEIHGNGDGTGNGVHLHIEINK